MKLVARAIRAALSALGYLVALIGTTTVLFAALNFAAWRYEQRISDPVTDVTSAVSWPGSAMSLPIYRRIFGAKTDAEAMARFDAAPSLAFHPTLGFVTQQTDNRFYRIGIEGIRYEPGWDDARVRVLLDGSRSLTFALGGSTMLGHGVAGDETIPFYLNQSFAATAGPAVINFGAQAYDQQSELAKLIQLLQIGYRPQTVIFLDGWNDLFLSRSNMRLPDGVIYHGFVMNRGEIAFTPGAPMSRVDYLKVFAESLPLYRVYEGWQRGSEQVEAITPDRDPITQGFDFREADFLFRHWEQFGLLHRDRFREELIRYYQSNLKLLHALSIEYGFRLLVFYQPIEFLDPANPFMTPAARETPGYRYIADLVAAVRAEIATGRLPMIDLSDVLEALPGDRALDIAHYSPKSNRLLSQAIAEVSRRQ